PSPLPFAFSCAFLLSHRQSRVGKKNKKNQGTAGRSNKIGFCNTRTGSKIAVQAQHTDVSYVGGKRRLSSFTVK
ncbi:hypothetical protein GQ607_011132, partial [Colletotrichum asianum]